MVVLFVLLLAGTVAGAYFYVSRMRTAILAEQKHMVEDLIAGGEALRSMPDDELHRLHMNIHEELKRRMAR